METIYKFPNLYSSFRVTGINYAKAVNGWSFASHSHSCFEFLYCISGIIAQTINGIEYVLEEGDSLVIKAGASHSTFAKTDMIWFGFHFDVEMKEFYEVIQKIIHPVISVKTESQGKSIHTWIEQIMQEFGTQLVQNFDEKLQLNQIKDLNNSLLLLTIHAHILEFIVVLTRYYADQSQITQSSALHTSQFQIAYQAAAFMEATASENTKINDLARQLNVHRSYLSDCFKKVYGMSPRSYWSQIRMREAKKLLQETDLTIEAISEQLHYSSTSHFCYNFRKMTQTTPQQFRNHLDSLK
jgi:AraC-like DNA-binding protein